MKLERHPDNPILKSDSHHPWEAQAVMNSSLVFDGKTYHMLYRALSHEKKVFPSGRVYHRSTIGYATSTDGISFERNSLPLVAPEKNYESLGCEDPRVIQIEETYYIFYTAVADAAKDDISVQIALATTKDFTSITKHGIIELEGRCKAAALLPEKINGKYAFFYTQHADTPHSTILYAEIPSIETLLDKAAWGSIAKHPLITPPEHAYRGPELGAVPIKTEKGWLFIYCPESFKHEWSIGAALLDLNNPSNVISRTSKPILTPETDYELSGYTNNVTFPSGAVIKDDKLLVYYGGADQGICLAECKVQELLFELVEN